MRDMYSSEVTPHIGARVPIPHAGDWIVLTEAIPDPAFPNVGPYQVRKSLCQEDGTIVVHLVGRYPPLMSELGDRWSILPEQKDDELASPTCEPC